MDHPRATAYVLAQLRRHLAPALPYHGPHHTLDVVEQAASLAAAEDITDPNSTRMTLC